MERKVTNCMCSFWEDEEALDGIKLSSFSTGLLIMLRWTRYSGLHCQLV